jgi:undecaprenyl-diphosphatase
MTLSEAIIYGVVQGITEFLPVSSSGHLAITHWILNTTDPESDVAFDVALHIGTLVPVVLYFWKDWLDLIKGFLGNLTNGQVLKNQDSVLLLQLVLATIPGALFGLLFEKQAKTIFRSPLSIASMMIVMGAVLWLADRRANSGKKVKEITWLDTLLVGCSQAFAIIPGVSRSGVTMTTGLFRNFNRETAARFSFLMSAPIIFGAAVHELPELIKHGIETDIAVGVITAAVVGFIAIAGMMKYIQKNSFTPFVIYRFLFGAFIFIVYILRG